VRRTTEQTSSQPSEAVADSTADCANREYDQCGGRSFSGSKCCRPGFMCTVPLYDLFVLCLFLLLYYFIHYYVILIIT
jgi:hypothetical protein